MANRYLIRVDGALHKEIKLEADIEGLVDGEHTIQVDSYQDTEFLGSDMRNIIVSNQAALDPDYENVLEYASIQGLPLPSTEQQQIDNQLILDYKATGAWDKDDVFLKLKSTADPAFRLICWKRLVQCSVGGSFTWTATGFNTGSNGYIDPLYIPSTGTNFTLNDAYIGVVTGSFSNSGQRSLAGGYNGTSEHINFGIPDGADKYYVSMNGGALNGIVPLNGGAGGYFALNRTSATQVVLQTPGNNNIVITDDSVGVLTEKLFIGARARHDQGSTDAHALREFSYVTIGASRVNDKAAIEAALI